MNMNINILNYAILFRKVLFYHWNLLKLWHCQQNNRTTIIAQRQPCARAPC